MDDISGAQLAREREQALDEWRAWSRAALFELGELLIHAGRAPFDTPEEFVEYPSLLGIAPLGELLVNENPLPGHSSRSWLHSRVMAYLGELVIFKFDGIWTVDTDPDSPTFARYVVLARNPESDRRVLVDVGEHAYNFLCGPKGRSLLHLVAGIETQIVTA